MALVIHNITLDCRDLELMSNFWEAATGFKKARSGEDYILLVNPLQKEPQLYLQKVPESKTAKNRMHIDFRTPDMERETARLEALGATRREKFNEGVAWWFMEDPEGNEFCVAEIS